MSQKERAIIHFQPAASGVLLTFCCSAAQEGSIQLSLVLCWHLPSCPTPPRSVAPDDQSKLLTDEVKYAMENGAKCKHHARPYLPGDWAKGYPFFETEDSTTVITPEDRETYDIPTIRDFADLQTKLLNHNVVIVDTTLLVKECVRYVRASMTKTISCCMEDEHENPCPTKTLECLQNYLS